MTALTTTLLLMVTGSLGAAPAASAHPCHAATPNSYVCDPASNGAGFFHCTASGEWPFTSCLTGLVFDNRISACNWPSEENRCLDAAGGGGGGGGGGSNGGRAATTTAATTTTTTTSPTTTTTTTTTPTPSTSIPTTTTTPIPTTTRPVSSTPTTTTATTTQPPSLPPSSGHDDPTDPCLAGGLGTAVCSPTPVGQYRVCGVRGVPVTFQCAAGLVFSNERQTCDWAATTACLGGPAPQPSPGVPGGDGGGVSVNPGSGVPGVSSSTTTTAATTTTTTATTTTTTAPLVSGPCNPATCVLPECRCMSSGVPGDLAPEDVPQMVLLTFDDDVSHQNFPYFEALFPAERQAALNNSNGCRTAATFFVSQTNSDMGLVKTLTQRGHEVASHSLTHSNPSWWSAADWEREMQGMREVLANATGQPLDKIAGMRAPFLELGGDDQFAMLQRNGFLYDSSMFGGAYQEAAGVAPLWPFTLQPPPAFSTAMCDQSRCPLGSYPGLWEVPLVRQYNLAGAACSMTDACNLGFSPSVDDVKGFLNHNFRRHYLTNRAPFVISLHANWFDRVGHSHQALREFLQELSAMEDVWQVTVAQMLQWVQRPLPLNRLGQIPSWQCDH